MTPPEQQQMRRAVEVAAGFLDGSRVRAEIGFLFSGRQCFEEP